jgi:ankyrin repeat protein
VLAALAALPAAAHETDQYTLPANRQFADLGPYFSRYFHAAIERGVEKTNARIRAELAAGRSPSQYHTPDAIAAAVNKEFPLALFLIEDLDAKMSTFAMKDRWPGTLPGYKPPPSMTKYLLYPLNPFRAWNCATLKVYGVHFGTDKLGHFTDMGMHYFRAYRASLRKGEDEQQALRRAVALGESHPIMSESGLLGYWTAGAYSNADMAVNYAGMLFYRNLTEPQTLKGVVRPAMLVRDGDYWRLAPHVRRDNDFFAWFVSEHVDEAINPSRYLPGMRDGMRKMAGDNATGVLEVRRDAYGNRRPQEYFRGLSRELRKYYGVEYGHRGTDEELVLVADVCFPKDENPADVNARDRFGRTALHRAAERGEVGRVRQLLDRGANIAARVRSDETMSSDWGNTPLHAAALSGRRDVVELLLSRGADVNAANDRGATPLHLAVEQPAVAQKLLEAGAKRDAADARGRTPLHWAASGSAYEGLALLLDKGAVTNVKDREGQTPLHLAAHAGNAAATAELLRRGADARIGDTVGVTPLHLAVASRSHAVAEALTSAGAPVDARDALGCTPLHEAARHRADTLVALLLNAGARPSVADGYGTTPLHLASRQGDTSVARLLLERGADANVRAGTRGTPIDEALRAGNAALVTLLKDDESRAGAASHRQ